MICNKCRIDTAKYNSLKGTQLASGRRGRAFKYCDPCFADLKILIKDYIKQETVFPHYLKYELDEKIAGKKNHFGITTDLKDAEEWRESSPLRNYITHTSNKYAFLCTDECLK